MVTLLELYVQKPKSMQGCRAKIIRHKSWEANASHKDKKQCATLAESAFIHGKMHSYSPVWFCLTGDQEPFPDRPRSAVCVRHAL